MKYIIAYKNLSVNFYLKIFHRCSLLIRIMLIPIFALLMFKPQTAPVINDDAFEKGKIVHYLGNDFEMIDNSQRARHFEDSMRSTNQLAFNAPSHPSKINGTPIHWVDFLEYQPKLQGRDTSLPKYLFNRLRGQIDHLNNGVYRLIISYLVIDKKGKIVYFNDVRLYDDRIFRNNTRPLINGGLIDPSSVGCSYNNDQQEQKRIKAIESSAEEELRHNNLIYRPAMLNGCPVVTIGNDHSFDYCIKITEHKSSISTISEYTTTAQQTELSLKYGKQYDD